MEYDKLDGVNPTQYQYCVRGCKIETIHHNTLFVRQLQDTGYIEFFRLSILHADNQTRREISEYYEHIVVSVCDRCKEVSVKLNDKLIYPLCGNFVEPNEYMPEDVKTVYLEALSIKSLSTRAAAALMRLCTELLCHHLGAPESKKLNEKIGWLVSEKKLETQLQQAFDSVRVNGNDGIHPGGIGNDDFDTEEIVDKMSVMVNLIVKQLIENPALIEAEYNKLSPTQKESIGRRDSKSKKHNK